MGWRITGFTMPGGISTCIWNPLRHATRYHWSEGGQLLREELPDGRDNHYSYDEAGRVTRFSDSGDKKITFARNIFGQITERTDPAGQCKYPEMACQPLRVTFIKNYFKIHNYFDK